MALRKPIKLKMTPEEFDKYAKIIERLAPTILMILAGASLFIVEIINAIRGKEFLVVSFFKRVENLIIGIIRELKEPDWRAKLNGFVCVIFGLIVIVILFFFIKTIFTDFGQILIPLLALWIFGFWTFLTYMLSVSFLNGYRK